MKKVITALALLSALPKMEMRWLVADKIVKTTSRPQTHRHSGVARAKRNARKQRNRGK